MNTVEEKDLAYYLRLPYRVEVYPEPDGSGYTAAIPALPGCITFADTMDELAEMIKDAKHTWIDCSLKDSLPIPEPSSVDAELIPAPRTIHRQLAGYQVQCQASLGDNARD